MPRGESAVAFPPSPSSVPLEIAVLHLRAAPRRGLHYQRFKWGLVCNLPAGDFERTFSLFYVLGQRANEYNDQGEKGDIT